MRRISQRLAEQAFGRRGIAPPREHEVDRSASGIDGSVEVAPTAPDTNIGLIDTPGPIGGLEMTAQPLLQFGTVALDPAPDCRVVRFQAALAEQLFDIAERERIPKVPAHGAQNQLGLGLPPLKDRRSDCLLHDLFRLPAAVGQSCNTTVKFSGSVADVADEERPPELPWISISPEIMSHAVWLYHRFGVRFRDAADLLAQHGLTVSDDAIRLWCLDFDSADARRLTRRQVLPPSTVATPPLARSNQTA